VVVEEITLSIDVGGSSYKAAIVDSRGSIIPTTYFEQPSYSDQPINIVLAALRETLERLFEQVQLLQRDARLLNDPKIYSISSLAMDFPGPFDYANGQSLMTHKFKSIKGIPLTPFIREIFPCMEIPIVFHHDLHACTYGAYLYDVGQGCSNLFCIAIGTGLGTGYMKEGKVVMRPGKQPMYPIFDTPYENGILEEYVANRGIVNQYRKRTGCTEALDAKQIDYLARYKSDKKAIAAYFEMGRVLGQAVKPLLEKLEVECLIFGGQISKGYDLFGPSLEKELGFVPSLRKIGIIQNLTETTIRGAAALPH